MASWLMLGCAAAEAHDAVAQQGRHPCSRLPLIDDRVVRCANQGCTLGLAAAGPVVTGWPLS